MKKTALPATTDCDDGFCLIQRRLRSVRISSIDLSLIPSAWNATQKHCFDQGFDRRPRCRERQGKTAVEIDFYLVEGLVMVNGGVNGDGDGGSDGDGRFDPSTTSICGRLESIDFSQISLWFDSVGRDGSRISSSTEASIFRLFGAGPGLYLVGMVFEVVSSVCIWCWGVVMVGDELELVVLVDLEICNGGNSVEQWKWEVMKVGVENGSVSGKEIGIG